MRLGVGQRSVEWLMNRTPTGGHQVYVPHLNLRICYWPPHTHPRRSRRTRVIRRAYSDWQPDRYTSPLAEEPQLPPGVVINKNLMTTTVYYVMFSTPSSQDQRWQHRRGYIASPVGDAYFTFPKAIKKAAGRSMGMLQADDWTRAAPSLCSCTLIASIFPYM